MTLGFPVDLTEKSWKKGMDEEGKSKERLLREPSERQTTWGADVTIYESY